MCIAHTGMKSTQELSTFAMTSYTEDVAHTQLHRTVPRKRDVGTQ